MQQSSTFNCPTCGAPLSTDGTQNEIKCSYCGNTVIVPESLRVKQRTDAQGRMYIGQETAQNLVIDMIKNPQKYGANQPTFTAPPVIMTTPIITPQKSGFGGLGCFITLIIIVSVLLPIGIIIYTTTSVTNSVGNIFNSVSTQVGSSMGDVMQIATQVKSKPSAKATRTMTPAGSAKNTSDSSDNVGEGRQIISDTGNSPILLNFGSQGNGNGFFDDARFIGIDGSGHIFTGEYTSGRVQMFDTQGKFIKSWIVDGKTPLRSLTVDQQGNVYAARSGVIIKYNSESGNVVSKIKSSSGFYDDVVALPDGGLQAYDDNLSNQALVRLDASGKVLKQTKNAIAQATDADELDVRIAVDGLGNIYALGTMGGSVYKFSPDGKFINKFGGRGDQPGQLQAPLSIAIDGQGQVYISDIFGIDVFSSDGRFIKKLQLEPGTVVFGMTFNDKNELVLAARDKVLKIDVSKIG